MKKIFCLAIVLVMTPPAFGQSHIKSPNVAGQFYDSDPEILSKNVEQYIGNASNSPLNKHLDIVIAPHAGYMYSGPVAGYSFKAVAGYPYKTIVILAPSHYLGFDGISLWPEGGFKTPLGVLDVDQDFTKKLMSYSDKFYFEPKAFDREHALEVELPFLQKTFKGIKIVPVIFGQPQAQALKDFANALYQTIGQRKDVLIVVSTDMSHYHDGDAARAMDQKTLAIIKALDVEQFYRESQLRRIEMCGFIPVTAALLYARQKGLNRVETLHYAHSGDVTGDNSRVVGYSAILIYQEDKPPAPNQVAALSLDQKKRLLAIAQTTIQKFVSENVVEEFDVTDPRLQEEEGAFVTIHKKGMLRGCIGNVLGQGPLFKTVRDMAIAAASEDPRFNPVSKEELPELDVEVSVLSKPWTIKSVDEIEMGKHGVILGQGYKRGLFLPQVATETGWSKEEFLAQLCSQKAGLSTECWKDPKTRIEIFTADVFSEGDLGGDG